MVIKVTTKNAKVATIHRGVVQNISKLYRVISTLTEEYSWIFSKPVSIQEEGIIEWHTDLVGKAIPYTQAEQETKVRVKEILRDVIYSILYGTRGEQFEVLKNAFEIPSLDDIFFIGDRVVLAQWGHIRSSFDAKRGIIFDLIGEEGAILKIKLLRDLLPEDRTPVDITFGEKKLQIFSDSNGEVDLFLPANVGIKIEILDEFNEIIKLKKGLNQLEIDLDLIEEPPFQQNQELNSESIKSSTIEEEPEILEEVPPPEPFTITVWDCKNDFPILGEGQLIIKAKDKEQILPIVEGKVQIYEWFGQEVLIDSLVKGFIPKKQKKITPQSSQSTIFCLEPMMEIEKEGAIGDPRFNISWKPSPEDIDIMVVTPCGDVIYYSEKSKKCKGFEGRLDIDIREEECQKREENCQENITFDNGGARGEYIIIVKKYNGTSSPTDITLTIINNGQKQVEKFTLYDVDDEKKFTIIH